MYMNMCMHYKYMNTYTAYVCIYVYMQERIYYIIVYDVAVDMLIDIEYIYIYTYVWYIESRMCS